MLLRELEERTQNLGFQFPKQLKYAPSPSAAQFQNPHSTEVAAILHVALPLLQSPLFFIGFIPISDVHSILYFILYKADQYPTSRKIQRPPLPGLVIYDVIIGLVFLPRKMFVSQAVLQRDTSHCSYPIQGNLCSLSPQALPAAHAGNKCQNPHPKHRVGVFKRENIAVA